MVLQAIALGWQDEQARHHRRRGYRGGYVAGYFWLGDYMPTIHGMFSEVTAIRVYHHKWQAVIFTPAAKVETLLTGNETIKHSVFRMRRDNEHSRTTTTCTH